MQQGKDIPTKFLDGDRFRAEVGEDGTVQIYRNGKLLVKRSVTALSLQFTSYQLPARALAPLPQAGETATPTPTATFTPTPTATPPPSGPITIDYVYDPQGIGAVS